VQVTLAYKTMAAIDAAIEADQGASFRRWLGKVLPHIGDAYRGEEEGHRSHLGASILGQECARAVWYNFHWTTRSNFPGRILRLFNRGHLEEGRIIALLLMIGCEVFQQDAEGKQYRISFAEGHAGGSGDGVTLKLPDLPAETAVLDEFKTHGETSFVELAGKLPEWRKHLQDPQRNPFTGKGVRAAKFEHYVQMQLYMRKMGLAVALYVAVCKNTDDLYMELVFLDTAIADQFLDRGEQLVWLPEPPKRISESPGFWKCRFCDHKPVCHLKAAPDVNCRTCVNSTPIAGAKWYCGSQTSPCGNAPIDKDRQLVGCDQYVRHDKI
jgi:hypothetical protein